MRKLDEAAWVGWRHRAEQEKQAGSKTDADLAAEISELVGYDLGRALVNHWFRGKRVPSLVEFMALCSALGADPGHILLNVRVGLQGAPEGSQIAQALRTRGGSPAYLKKSAKRLKVARTAPKAPLPRKSKVPT